MLGLLTSTESQDANWVHGPTKQDSANFIFFFPEKVLWKSGKICEPAERWQLISHLEEFKESVRRGGPSVIQKLPRRGRVWPRQAKLYFESIWALKGCDPALREARSLTTHKIWWVFSQTPTRNRNLVAFCLKLNHQHLLLNKILLSSVLDLNSNTWFYPAKLMEGAAFDKKKARITT